MKAFESNGQHLLILKRGERIMDSILKACEEHQLEGGRINGIGALCRPELGFYDLKNKSYIRKEFAGDDYELLSLVGNISLKEGKPFAHIHVVLGDREFQTFGGHLFGAEVAVTAEVSIIPFGSMPIREFHDSIGLDLICRLN